MTNVSIMTYNVNGLGDEKKRRKVFNYLHEHKYDVIMMQETHSVSDSEKRWTNEWGGKIFFSHGTQAARGTAIMFRKNFDFKLQNQIIDPNGRYLILTVNIDNIDLVLVSVYAPNVDDPRFFVQMFEIADTCDGRKIYAGDFNTILQKQDIKGGKGYSHPLATELINNHMDHNDLVDIWRIRNPDKFKSTFRRQESTIASALMERIDFILIDSSLCQHVQECDIAPAFASDHSMPYVKFSVSQQPPGPGYWKFNNLLLEDDIFVETAVTTITNVLTDRDLDIFDRWELMKFSIKQVALKRSIQLAKGQKEQLAALRKKLAEIEEQRDQCNLDSFSGTVLFNDHEEQSQKIKQEIDEIHTKRTEGCMIRSRAQWYEFSEKSSKYFYALEKLNYNRKTIYKIRDNNGDIQSEADKVMDVLNSYYERLFAKEGDGHEIDPDYLALLNISQVKESDAYWLAAPIQLEEIHLALKDMNLGKCPGTDGLNRILQEILANDRYGLL